MTYLSAVNLCLNAIPMCSNTLLGMCPLIGATEAGLNHFLHGTSIFISKLTLVEFESSLTP